jgi:nucleoid DNA-binding protein|tara:strand:+ start:832 stop:1137 length:306 start_codon:yes stop_codon:yes gene_type:complete
MSEIINSKGLIELISEKLPEFSKKQIAELLKAEEEAVIESIAKGHTIRRVGYLTIKVMKRKATTGRNPQTGEKLEIAEKMIAKAKTGKLLEEAADEFYASA